MLEAGGLDRHRRGHSSLAGGSVAKKGNARDSRGNSTNDPSVHSGGGGLSHVAPTAELGALVLEGDDGHHGVLNNNGLGVVLGTATVVLCDVLAVAVLVGGGVGEDVRTSQLNVHTAVWDTVGKGAIKGVGAGSLLLGVREGSLNGVWNIEASRDNNYVYAGATCSDMV